MAKAEWSQTNVLHTCHSYTENFFGLKNILVWISYPSSYDDGVHTVHGTTQSLLYLITLKPRVMKLGRQFVAVSDHFNSDGLRQVRRWSILILSLVRYYNVCNISCVWDLLLLLLPPTQIDPYILKLECTKCKRLKFSHSINMLQNLLKRWW